MKTKVFMREESLFKTVDISSEKKPFIENEIREKWQKILNTIADLIGVSAALIMKISIDKLEIFLKDENGNESYTKSATEALGDGLYCETAIGRNEAFYVENALDDDDWKDNPSIHSHMVSYFGLPIHWSDSEIFGTLCILNKSELKLDQVHKDLIVNLKEIIEIDLKGLIERVKFDSFFDMSLDLHCITTIQGDIIRANKAWEKTLGYKVSTLEQMNFNDLIHPEDLESTENAIKELMRDKKIFNFVNRYQDKAGNNHFIQWNSKLVGEKNNIYASAREITETMIQNEKLKQKKKELDFILAGIDGGTWQWDVQTGKIKINKKWAEMLGYDLQELQPTTIETWKNLTHPEDFKKSEEKLKQHFNNEINQYDVQLRMRHKDGHWIWVNDLGKVMSWTKDNKPYKMFGVHIDISERKEKEEKINDMKALLENLTNQVPGSLYQLKRSPEGTLSFQYASTGIYNIYELSPEEFLGDASKVFGNIHPLDYNKVITSIEKSAKDLTPWHQTYRIVLKEQGLKWLEGKAVPEKLRDGSILWHGYINDITEKRKREEKVKASEKRYRTIFESAPNPVLLMDSKGNYKDINLRALQLLGYSKEELLRLNAMRMVAPEDKALAIKKNKELFSTGKMTTEIKLVSKDQKKLDVILDAVYLEEDLYLGFVKDITQRKKAQEAINFQNAFQKELARISGDILTINAENFNEKMNAALSKMGKFFNLDGSYIFKYKISLDHFILTHKWTKKEFASNKFKPESLKTITFPWWMNKLLNDEVIYIKDLSEIPVEAAVERKLLKDRNIKSLIVNPIFIENIIYGFFCFDIIDAREPFTKNEVELFRIFTNLMKNAINRYHYDLKIKELSYKDHLTGLYNRRFFEEELERLDTKRQLPLSIIVGDINGLKIINDSLGHKCGDELLKKAAGFLRLVTRDEDILARLSGDEFAILLPKMDKKSGEKIIKRINNLMNENSNTIARVSIALGLAVKTQKNQGIKDVLQMADSNMYQNKIENSSHLKSKIVDNLLMLLANKSNETKQHSKRMEILAINFSEKLKLSSAQKSKLSILARLHDIGKITIAKEILKKTGELSSEDWIIVKNHCENGYKIANASEEFAFLAKDILAHHEHWDGGGYPNRLKEKSIPYLARIITIIDAYDVMIHDQPYKKKISKEEAIKEIEACAGTQFDPRLAVEFTEMLRSEEHTSNAFILDKV